MSHHRQREGVTLIELIVALTIIGITSAIVLLAIRDRTDGDGRDQALAAVVNDARQIAISSGRPYAVRDPELIAFPDGSVLGDSSLHIDRLSGVYSRAESRR